MFFTMPVSAALTIRCPRYCRVPWIESPANPSPEGREWGGGGECEVWSERVSRRKPQRRRRGRCCCGFVWAGRRAAAVADEDDARVREEGDVARRGRGEDPGEVAPAGPRLAGHGAGIVEELRRARVGVVADRAVVEVDEPDAGVEALPGVDVRRGAVGAHSLAAKGRGRGRKFRRRVREWRGARGIIPSRQSSRRSKTA